MKQSFMRIFRLFWLADFGFYELEGYNSTLDMDPVATRELYLNVTGVPSHSLDLSDGAYTITSLGDGDMSEYFTNGIGVLIVCSVFLGTIMFMNVCTAILENKYDEINGQLAACARRSLA